MSAGGVSRSAFNLAEDVPTVRRISNHPFGPRQHTRQYTPEEDKYMQYFDWDRFEAEQGDEVEAAEQGGEQGGEE
jgi:hypothetical protein